MGFFQSLTRKKVLSDEDVENTGLDRCLTTLDLIGLGIGSTLGAGLYVVAGQVAHDNAGPAVTLSFLVAALASTLAGMCYAEFAARIPRAGSAYIYSYVTIGEFMAFIIGWNLVLEYIIGSASVARGWSGYFDSMIDYKISNAFNSSMHMGVSQLSDYPDFFAFGITIFITVLLAVGVKESTRFNNLFTCVNLFVVLYVFICGLFKIDWDNWHISKDTPGFPSTAGNGGFMPFGFSGMMSGAATCFYAFVGFDCVATTGEETKNPQRSIPIGIVVSLIIIFLAYFLVSAVITLMCPYYLLDVNSPLPFIFKRAGWDSARYIISVGAICALSTSLLGGMFPLPRILYAMGSDGLIFRFMATVHPRLKTPVIGTALSGIFAGVMAMMFNLKELVDMMSIGTLLAYTLVALSVLILRYEADANLAGHLRGTSNNDEEPILEDSTEEPLSLNSFLHPIGSQANVTSARVTKITLAVLCVVITIFNAFVIFCDEPLGKAAWWAVAIATILGLVIVLCVALIWRQPMNKSKLHFTVPLVPLSPAVSALVNIYLMLKLSYMTWVRFGVWMVVGLLIYFLYGIKKSSEGKKLQDVIFNRRAHVPSVSVATKCDVNGDSPMGSAGSDLEGSSRKSRDLGFNERSRLIH